MYRCCQHIAHSTVDVPLIVVLPHAASSLFVCDMGLCGMEVGVHTHTGSSRSLRKNALNVSMTGRYVDSLPLVRWTVPLMF